MTQTQTTKENPPIVAICYDFDKTLTPTDMQAQGFIQSLGFDVNKFWEESNGLADDNGMDQNLAWMYMLTKAAEGNFYITKDKLREFGADVALFPGVETWFARIREYGKMHGIQVEHYIISSGLKEIILGTSIAQEFEKIYASSYYYNDKNVAVWPAQVVNYTDKTQFLFRIEKGVLDVNDDKVNKYFPPHELRVPFRNFIYIGDSDTDIPCMKLVNINGGHSIGVYNLDNLHDGDKPDKSKVFRMLEENRIRYFAPADYAAGSQLEVLIKSIIDQIKTRSALEKVHYDCVEEKNRETESFSPQDKQRAFLIDSLGESTSYKNTHNIIREMTAIDKSEWTEENFQEILDIPFFNSQVNSILHDTEIAYFYKRLIVYRKAEDNPKAQEILRRTQKPSE
ncbi:HAD family hydrolase [Alloscardovia criceti]|uniref:HAD family hydrolase n=1 Tax=Alloscardovia criceti TaxID=356828 RepID=UPI00037B6733|nr:HAD family hydrolase [Alloscardovia criceti]